MKKTILALALLSTNAFAGPSGKTTVPPPPPPPACSISYDFVEAGYGHIWGDDDADADGAYFTFSKSITGNLFGFVEASQYWADDVDFFSADAGLGFHLPLTPCIDWAIKGAVVYDKVESSDEVWSGIASTGLRIAAAPWLEVNAFYNIFFEDFDRSVNGGTLAFIFPSIIAPKVDLVAAGVVTEEGEAVTLGVRYNF